jgi:hypothetical protein
MKRKRLYQRLAVLLLAVVAALGLAFTNSATSSATIQGYGTTTSFYGWNYDYVPCYGNNTSFLYQGFRASKTLVQFRWQTQTNGTMRVRNIKSGEYHDIATAGNPDSFKAKVYWLNWYAGLRYEWELEWHWSGLVCGVYFWAG